MIILETERLILRTWEEQDIDPMAAIDQDPKVCEFLSAIGNRANTEAGVQKIMQDYEQHGFSLYAVELKSTYEFIGWTGLAVPSFTAHFTPAVEIGWRLASKHWNQGYATEAAKAVLHYAFTVLNLNEIVSFTAVNNQASRRVMEKIGLHHNPQDDFDHPKLEKANPLSRHVLYRITKEKYLRANEIESVVFIEAKEHELGEIICLIADDELGASREKYMEPLLDNYKKAFKHIEQDSNAKLIVAKLDGEIIGLAQINFITYLTYQGGTRAQIEGVRIHKNYRSKGIGEKLFAYLINLAKEHNCHLMQLTTNKSRPQAHQFYKRLGFMNSHEGFKLDLSEKENHHA